MIYDYMINILPTDRELMDTRLWAWPTYLGLSSVAAFCAQMFFARRVFACESLSDTLVGVDQD
jgi:hypothetical protein